MPLIKGVTSHATSPKLNGNFSFVDKTAHSYQSWRVHCGVASREQCYATTKYARV